MGTKKGGKVRGIHKSARRSSENGGRPIGTKVQMQRDISVKILKGTSSNTDGLTKNQIIRLQKKAEKLEAMKKAQEGLQAVHILSEEVESLKSNWLKAFKAKEYEAKIGLDYTISTSVKLAAFNKLENDFRDLFNIANEMAMNLDSFTDEAGNCHIKFHAWKKARGIE